MLATTSDGGVNGFVSPNLPMTLDPINEASFNLRKASLNLPSQRKAVALYKAPVVQNKYKRVISHFNKPKNSYTNGHRLEPIATTKSSGQDFEAQFLAESKEGLTIDSHRKPLDLNSPVSPSPGMSEYDGANESVQSRPIAGTYMA